MSDSIVVNVLSPEVTNINVNDTGENIYINPLTLNQGIINHSVTHQSGGSDELLHNLLGGLQGGFINSYYHLTSGEYANLVTGTVVRPSDTGAFYPNSNPSGFITGVDLSAYITGDVVRPSETGNFITASQTGAFYPRSNPSGFITGVDLSAYVTGDVVRPSETGIFYLASNPSGFITGVDLSAYVTGSVVRPSETGDFINFNSLTGDRGDVTVTGNSPSNLNFSIDNFAITSGKIADSAVTTAKIANFNVTTDKLSSLSVTTNIIATNAVTNTKLADMASQRIKGRISAGTSDPEDLTASQVRTLIDFDHTVSGLLSGYVTGSVVRPSETGAFYAASNPSGFITGVDLSFSGNYYTKSESESRYVNTTGTETILGDKTFHDRVYINNLYVTGLETIVNTTNTNVASNFIMLNLTGGAVDGGLFFVTGAGLTGINDSGAILGFDHSDKFKFGIGTRASDLSVLDTIASVEEMTGISGNLQTQISSLSNATGSYVLNSQTGAFYPTSNPSGFVTGLVVRPSETGSFITTAQTGSFYAASNPSGYVTGSVVRPSETGSFITSSQTGAFYPTSNPSGFATLSDPTRTTVTGNGATSVYAISGASGLTNPSALIVAIDGALQEPSVDYTVSGGNITFTSALPSGSKAVVVSPVNTVQVGQVTPSDGSVTSAKLDNALTIQNLTSPLASIDSLIINDQATAENQTYSSFDSILTPRVNAGLRGYILNRKCNVGGTWATSHTSGGGSTSRPSHVEMFTNTTLGSKSYIYEPQLNLCELGAATRNGYSTIKWDMSEMWFDWVFNMTYAIFSSNIRTNQIVRFFAGDVSVDGMIGGYAGGIGVRIDSGSSATNYDIRIFHGFGLPYFRAGITAATNASPIVVTQNNHGFQTNDQIEIDGCTGNTATNGIWTVTRINSNTYSLNGSTGNGTLIAGGGSHYISNVLLNTNAFGGKLARIHIHKTNGVFNVWLNDTILIGSVTYVASGDPSGAGAGYGFGSLGMMAKTLVASTGSTNMYVYELNYGGKV
jgi:hypothetical protein